MSPLELLPELCEGCSESNASYFIMLAHVRGGCWWCDSRDWTFPPNIPLDAAAVWQMAAEGHSERMSMTWKCIWSKGVQLNSSMWKKIHPLTFTDTCWTLMEIKQDGDKHGTQPLVHRWRRCIASGGDYVEKYKQVLWLRICSIILCYYVLCINWFPQK